MAIITEHGATVRLGPPRPIYCAGCGENVTEAVAANRDRFWRCPNCRGMNATWDHPFGFSKLTRKEQEEYD